MTIVMCHNNSSITFVTDEEMFMALTSKLPVLLAVTLAAAALCSSAETPKAATQLDAACPVELTQLRIHDNKLIFRNRNSSGQYIKKIALGAAYLDSGNVPHRIDVQGGWKDLHAGFVLDSALDIKSYRKTGAEGWVIWPEKVLFSDGSLWQINHATTNCGLQATKTSRAEVAQIPVEFLASNAGTGGN
jgi:hypothetical protein